MRMEEWKRFWKEIWVRNNCIFPIEKTAQMRPWSLALSLSVPTWENLLIILLIGRLTPYTGTVSFPTLNITINWNTKYYAPNWGLPRDTAFNFLQLHVSLKLFYYCEISLYNVWTAPSHSQYKWCSWKKKMKFKLLQNNWCGTHEQFSYLH